MPRSCDSSLRHICLPKLQKKLHIDLVRHIYGLLRVYSRLSLYLYYTRSAFLARITAFHARIGVFLAADRCFPSGGLMFSGVRNNQRTASFIWRERYFWSVWYIFEFGRLCLRVQPFYSIGTSILALATQTPFFIT